MTYNHYYDDILNLSHHISKKHPPMSLYARSCQFAPFAALTGYEDAVIETGRETFDRIEMDEERKSILDAKLQYLIEENGSKKMIKITYFVPDARKAGGQYISSTGIIKKIDEYERTILFTNHEKILIDDIIDIDIDDK